MFARTVSMHLKPNSSEAFTRLIQSDTIPALRKQKGFQGELTLVASGGAEVVAISVWDNQTNAEAYARDGYPAVMNNLTKFVEGAPRIQTYDVGNSTFFNIAATVTAGHN